MPRVNRSGVGDANPTLIEPQRVSAPKSASAHLSSRRAKAYRRERTRFRKPERDDTRFLQIAAAHPQNRRVFAVEDANGVALAYVYFEDDPSRRGLVNRLSGADAKAVAQTIARALTAEAERA